MKSIFEEAICQLCLRVDIKVYKISDVQHVFIESILKLNDIHYVPSENLSICSICMALFLKTFDFVQTIWRAQEIVYDLLQNIDIITISSLRGLDRHKIGLNPMKLKSKAITCITKVIYDIHEIENLDNNNTLDVDPEEHHSITTITKKSEENVEIICNEGVVELNECNEELVDTSHVDYGDNRHKPLLSVVKSNPRTLDLGAIEYDSINKCNEATFGINNGDNINITKDTFLSVIKPNPVTLDLGTFESDNLNVAPVGINHEDDGEDTKDPLLSDIKSNLVIVDLGAIEYDSLNETNDSIDAKDPLLSVIKSDPVILDIGDNTHLTQVKKLKKKKVPKKRKEKEIVIEFDSETPTTQVTEEKKKRVPKKKEQEIVLEFDAKTPSEDEKQQLEKDGDYMPAQDSTSHSEDSAFDDFDDNGRKIVKPTHGLVYPRKCDNCNYEVQEHKFHFLHYTYMHPDIPYPYGKKKIYACSVCGKLMTAGKINTHEKNHIDQKLQCPKCPKIFPNKIRLYRHVQSVHPKKILICDYCSKGFKTRNELCTHLRIHTGTKPFKCHICDATFAHSGNRLVHIRSAHQNIRYVPKKQVLKSQKARSKNKQDSYDSDESSDEVTLMKRKKRAKPSSKSRKTKNNVDGNKKSKRMKKKKSNVGKEICEKNNTLNAIPENNDTDSESEDEVLSEIKRKKTSSE